MGGTGIIDQFLEAFTRYIDSGFGLLGGEVGFLATTLARSMSRWRACSGLGARRGHPTAPRSRRPCLSVSSLS